MSSFSEQLIMSAGEFTNAIDAVAGLKADLPQVVQDLPTLISRAWYLGDLASALGERLHEQGLRDSAVLEDVTSQLRHLTDLTSGAARHLQDAVVLLGLAHSPFQALPAGRKAELVEGGAAGISAAMDQLAPAPDLLVDAAEQLAVEVHQKKGPAGGRARPSRLSAAQSAALRAIARGRVEISRLDGPVKLLCRGYRVPTTTVQALQRRNLLHRQPLPGPGPMQLVPDRERLGLSWEGAAVLAAAFTQPPPAHRPRPALAPPQSHLRAR
ncbi:hypothetical protein [Streptomyces noursei]|uniref:hypothetical protein n=1 Tax=Streptomyces noursei TaxID=1971 RepID=UPI0023B7DE62|nr:hypothetical protein [Streptomyces noursei]